MTVFCRVCWWGTRFPFSFTQNSKDGKWQQLGGLCFNVIFQNVTVCNFCLKKNILFFSLKREMPILFFVNCERTVLFSVKRDLDPLPPLYHPWGNVPVKSKLQHPPPPPTRAYPGHLTRFSAREGGNLITTHRGWGIWSLASISCYESRWFHVGCSWVDKSWRRRQRRDKLWWIQKKRLRIRGGLVENQRPTQALFCIWRCLRPIYIYI